MGWTVLEYGVQRLTSDPAGATGKVTIAFPLVPPGQVWRVEGIAIWCPTSQTVTCFAYDLTPSIGAPVPAQGTRDGALTWDDQASPLTIPGGNALTLVFLGVGEGKLAKARVQYVSLTGTGGAPTPVAT